MNDKPKCTNCGHTIDFLTSVSGEVWGGFADGEGLPPERDEAGRYRGRWYWEFWVYMPETHAVCGESDRIRIDVLPPDSGGDFGEET